MNFWRACLLFAMGSIVLHAQSPERRVAVVIGNSDYHKVGTVHNAAPDAAQVATTLRQLGFTLIPPSNPSYAAPDPSMAYVNLGLQDMNSILTQMEDNVAPGDLVVFYFAGHCVQHEQLLYLMPTDAVLGSTSTRNLERAAIKFDDCVTRIREKGAQRIIMIIDGCRNNPGGDPAKAEGGLIRAGDGIFVALATAGGTAAKDGRGSRSPMADALLSELAIPGKSVEEIFESVRERVLAATGASQRPFFCRDPADWRSVVLNQNVRFMPPSPIPGRPGLPVPTPPAPPVDPAPFVLARKTTLYDQPGGTAQGETWKLAPDLGGTMVEVSPPSGQPAPAGWHYLELSGWVVEHGANPTDGSIAKTYLEQTPSGLWKVTPSELSMRHDPSTSSPNAMATLLPGTLVEELKVETETNGRSWRQVLYRGWVRLSQD